jgi:hypothetical protein
MVDEKVSQSAVQTAGSSGEPMVVEKVMMKVEAKGRY